MADNVQNITIKLNGDAKSAVRAISGVRVAITNVGRALKGAFTFVSKINWVIAGIHTLVEGFKKLDAWIHRNEIAARSLRRELADLAHGTAIANISAAYEKLNKELKIANELERERSAILDKRKATERDLEDAEIERDKQLEISGLDPSDAEYEKKKKEIELKYASKESSIDARRAAEDNKAKTEELYRKADAKEDESAMYAKKYRSATKVAERELERSWAAEMEARSGGEEEKKRAKELHESWVKAYEFAQKIKERMEEAEREAQSLRNQAGELVGGNQAAKLRDEATQARIAREKEEEEYAAFEEEKRRARESDDAAREFAESARQEMEADAESKLSGVRASYESAMGAGQVSQNRLTALGLGSGVRGSDVVATDMRKIIDILEQQLTATRENEPAGPGQATFTE